MCTEVNSGVGHGCGDDPVTLPPSAVEKRAAKGNNCVVVDVTRWERSPPAGTFFFGGMPDARLFQNSQKRGICMLQFNQTDGLHLFRTRPSEGILQRVDHQTGETQRKQGAKDECASLKTTENSNGTANDDKYRSPERGVADDWHEQIESGIRPALVNEMKNCFVHSCFRSGRQNKSARIAKQRLLLATVLTFLAGRVPAQNFPNAQDLLANVRLRQSQQQIDLRGQLRQDARTIPFHLVQNGPDIRYVFRDPDETLHLKIGGQDSRLEQISRAGAQSISQEKLDEKVRGTAISYEDLALKFLYWPNARVAGADFIRTRNCWKMEMHPPGADSQYASILLWIDKDNGALMRMEGYDSSGRLVKRFEVVSAQKIEGRWFLKQMRVEAIEPSSGRVSARAYLEINA